MRTNKFLKFLVCSVLMGQCLTSCDDSNDPDNVGDSAKILIETAIKNPDGTSGSSYIQFISDFSKQSLDNKNGIQVGFDASVKVYGNNVYVFPEFGKDGTQEVIKYTYNDMNLLSKSATLQLPPMSGAFNMVKASDEKAYISLYNLGKILIFNPTTMTKTGEIDLSQYATDDNNPDPAMPFIRNGLLYVPLNQIGANWMPNHEKKQVDVAIIDTQILLSGKTIIS